MGQQQSASLRRGEVGTFGTACNEFPFWLFGGVSESYPSDPLELTPSQLEECTRDDRMFLGRGGFGRVYRGRLIPPGNERNVKSIGLEIAVKVSRGINPRIQTQFEAEKNYLPIMEHENIIKLVGYCETPEKLYLVYPFMPNGTVERKLLGLDWSTTIKTLKGVAAAIEKLHSHEPALIYRDLKPDNILLDKDFTPKLADFGAVTVEGECFCFGTPGYTDPIVMNNGPGTKPNDIYSFGVVTLQLIMKEEKILLGGNECSEHITKWAERVNSREGHVVDYRLLKSKGCSLRAAKVITYLAFECVRPIEQRPTITQVLNWLSLLDGSHSESRRIQP